MARMVLACIVASASLVASAGEAAAWVKLFDGETTYGWANEGGQLKAEGSVLVFKGPGVLYTTAQFGDFDLKVNAALTGSGKMCIRGRENGAIFPVDGMGSSANISLKADGAKVNANIDGEVVNAETAAKTGAIAFVFEGEGTLRILSASLAPLNMKPLFNGQNLEGWSILPDHASVFTVVDGALNIKNGNGQIETTGKYKDFIFQAEVFSNGDHLNSGIFFRSPVGVFWRGYEAQIRNQWEGDDRTKPVDFGTGGLYAILPTRKVISSDREWFTYTISCKDNHIAVWLNGYQTADYTDTRPVDADGNSKAGSVPEAGTITLQGHDPTTDLSFKNIVIQEYAGE